MNLESANIRRLLRLSALTRSFFTFLLAVACIFLTSSIRLSIVDDILPEGPAISTAMVEIIDAHRGNRRIPVKKRLQLPSHVYKHLHPLEQDSIGLESAVLKQRHASQDKIRDPPGLSA